MVFKKIIKWLSIFILVLVLVVIAIALLTPVPKNPDLDLVILRQEVVQPHHLFETSDGETLFVRRWDPVDSLSKKGVAVLILHGITAHSKAYDFMAEPMSNAGYTTFGLDYRGHGLSGGHRGDSPGKERSKADYLETVQFIKELGYSKVVVIGHSFGVASAIFLAKLAPDQLDGLVLLSGAYEGKLPPREFSWFEKLTILTNSVIRPSTAVIAYERDGMEKREDPLFNYVYTLRFATMLDDQSELVFQDEPSMPVLVGVGDRDELFTVDAVRELYNGIPGENKEFWVIENALHASFPTSCWNELVDWLDRQHFDGAPM